MWETDLKRISVRRCAEVNIRDRNHQKLQSLLNFFCFVLLNVLEFLMYHTTYAAYHQVRGTEREANLIACHALLAIPVLFDTESKNEVPVPVLYSSLSIHPKGCLLSF